MRNGWHQTAVKIEFNDIDVDVAFALETVAEFGYSAGEARRATCSIEHKIEIKRPDVLACCRMLARRQDANVDFGSVAGP